MALTSNGVALARDISNSIKVEEAKLSELSNILKFMESNAEFNKFLSGTKFGSGYFEKWQSLLALISGDLYQALVNMENATVKFLEQQESYNNRLSEFQGKIIGGAISHQNQLLPGSPGPAANLESYTQFSRPTGGIVNQMILKDIVKNVKNASDNIQISSNVSANTGIDSSMGPWL